MAWFQPTASFPSASALGWSSGLTDSQSHLYLFCLYSCHLLLEMVIVASNVVSAFSLLFSSSSSLLPSHVTSRTKTNCWPVAHGIHLRHGSNALHYNAALPQTQRTFSACSSLCLRLPTGTSFSWPNRSLTYIYAARTSIFCSRSLPWRSCSLFSPFLSGLPKNHQNNITTGIM